MNERFEELAESDVDAGAERHHCREADVVRTGEVEHRGANGARLRDEREPARTRQRRAERRVEPDVGAHDAECAGTENAYVLRSRHGQEIALPRLRGRTAAFGVREQHRRAHLPSGLLQDAGDRARRCGDDGEVDRLADACDRGVDRAAEKVATVRIDGVHASRVRAAQQFSYTVRPSEPSRSEAPISATDFGVSNGARECCKGRIAYA